MLPVVIRGTAGLLAIGAALVVVGLFDAYLGWDIFSPRLEALLYGVFFSSLCLAAAGVAVCFVLGIEEVSLLVRTAQRGEPLPPPVPARRYVRRLRIGFAGLALLVGGLDLLDRRVQVHRSAVFKHLAEKQMAHFGAKLARELSADGAPTAVSPALSLLVTTVRNLDFVGDANLYLPDASDAEALWRYAPGWPPRQPPHFERIFATRDSERAARDAFDGDAKRLERFNERSHFVWLATVGDGPRPRGVVSISADVNQDLREFLVSD